MPTIKELVDDVHSDKNAVSAAKKGMDAITAFAADLRSKMDSGHIDEAKVALVNLAYLVEELNAAIPANVTPASAGPVGKSPHEQYLEQASGAVAASLEKMVESVKAASGILTHLDAALQHINNATANIKHPDLMR